MVNLSSKVEKIFKGAAKSFYRFPASIISALVISIVAIIRISMDWEVEKTYNILFDSIQSAFFLAAVFSMATVALVEVKKEKEKPFFILANIGGILLAIISFLLLYFFGGKVGEDKIAYLSNISTVRVGVAVFTSMLAFIYISSKARAIDSFSDSFFISQRAFVISSIYGLVIMIGVSGVLGAFQSLVYRDMDFRIYQYLGVLVGFLTYTIFLGYFPSFKASENKDEIEMIKKQPRFIFVLFDYILIPIIMALTVVLLIWSLRVILKGVDVSFNRLSSIASTYVIIGIWLHIMVAKHKTKIAESYKRLYPFAGILILIFEAWALFVQLNKFGLKTTEYSFLMIWIFAMISILLLIFLNIKAYRKIAIVAIIIAIVWVLPIVGYRDVTFNSQVKRLEEILTDQDLLINDKIVASNNEIKRIRRGEITDAVDFISNSEKENTPDWFKENLNDENIFKNTFGFEKTYGVYPEDMEYSSINFRLKTDEIDISDYSLSLITVSNEKMDTSNSFKGKNGNYEILMSTKDAGIPKIQVKLEDTTIIDEDLGKYLDELLAKYSLEDRSEIDLPLEDMSFVLETKDIQILFVMESIDTYFERGKDTTDYYVQFHGVFVKYR